MNIASVDNLIVAPSNLLGQELERTDDSQEGLGELSSRERVYGKGAGGVVLASTLATKLGAVVGSSAPLLDRWVISARYAPPHRGDKNSVGENRRIRRFYQRYFTGVGVGGRLRILSLTSSDEAVAKGYDIHRHFRALVLRLRRRWGRFEYIGVKESKGDRQHLHLLFRGEYMEQVQLSAIWQALHASPVVDIRAMYKARGGARYLAKYLAKAVNRYWASYNWVFKGWVGWSKAVKGVIGHYPSRMLLRQLAKLEVAKRLEAMWFLCPIAMMGSA